MARKTKPEVCPYCKRDIPKSFYEDKAKAKGDRIKAVLSAKLAAGEPVGRPKTRDDGKILFLRKCGMSMREIAKEMGISSATVFTAIKEATNDNPA